MVVPYHHVNAVWFGGEGSNRDTETSVLSVRVPWDTGSWGRTTGLSEGSEPSESTVLCTARVTLTLLRSKGSRRKLAIVTRLSLRLPFDQHD